MSSFRFLAPRATRLLAALSLALAAAACDNNPLFVEPKLATTSIVLTVAGGGALPQTLTWTTATGAVVPARITLPTIVLPTGTLGTARTVTAQFLRANGTSDPVVTAGDYRLDFDVASGNSATIAKTGSFGATITTGTTDGNTVLTMRLVNVSEARTEYTSSQVSLQVQTPAATTNQGPLE
jgi:hypothetical protein